MSPSRFENAPSETVRLAIFRHDETEVSLLLSEKLDRALEATFPASDALSSLHVVQPLKGRAVMTIVKM
jgi:hypothetical protein